jgi:hypothetical protein
LKKWFERKGKTRRKITLEKAERREAERDRKTEWKLYPSREVTIAR